MGAGQSEYEVREQGKRPCTYLKEKWSGRGKGKRKGLAAEEQAGNWGRDDVIAQVPARPGGRIPSSATLFLSRLLTD